MGVISCRSREASLIPNYIRVKASARCYSSNLGAKPRGRKNAVPGVIAVQKKQDDPTCIVGSRAAARESTKRSGKTEHPARLSLCARHADNDNQFYFVVFILPGQLLSATRCRVDYHRINAGVVAPGESLRLIAAERPHSSQTINELKRRRNVTAVYYFKVLVDNSGFTVQQTETYVRPANRHPVSYVLVKAMQHNQDPSRVFSKTKTTVPPSQTTKQRKREHASQNNWRLACDVPNVLVDAHSLATRGTPALCGTLEPYPIGYTHRVSKTLRTDASI